MLKSKGEGWCGSTSFKNPCRFLSVRSHNGWGGERNTIRVWKPLPNRHVLKTLWESPKEKALFLIAFCSSIFQMKLKLIFSTRAFYRHYFRTSADPNMLSVARYIDILIYSCSLSVNILNILRLCQLFWLLEIDWPSVVNE